MNKYKNNDFLFLTRKIILFNNLQEMHTLTIQTKLNYLGVGFFLENGIKTDPKYETWGQLFLIELNIDNKYNSVVFCNYGFFFAFTLME